MDSGEVGTGGWLHVVTAPSSESSDEAPYTLGKRGAALYECRVEHAHTKDHNQHDVDDDETATAVKHVVWGAQDGLGSWASPYLALLPPLSPMALPVPDAPLFCLSNKDQSYK